MSNFLFFVVIKQSLVIQILLDCWMYGVGNRLRVVPKHISRQRKLYGLLVSVQINVMYIF